jgi:hypothetical protein
MGIASPSSPTATTACGCCPRNGYERSRQFGSVFGDLARLGRQTVLDGEIAAPARWRGAIRRRVQVPRACKMLSHCS